MDLNIKMTCPCGWEGIRAECVEIKVRVKSKIPRYDNTYTAYNGCPKCKKETHINDN